MRALLLALGAVVLAVAGCYPAWTSDLFGHLAAGRQIAELGAVPDHDAFSFYFGEPHPWRNHNWGSGLLFHHVHAALGFDGLVVLKVLVAAVLGALVVANTERKGLAAAICVLLLLWAVPSIRIRLSVRPHLIGLLAQATMLYGLARLAERAGQAPARRDWLIVLALGLLQIPWVNMHGSGPMAFLFAGAFLVGHFGDFPRQRMLAALFLLLIAGSCVTPFGPAILIETFKHVGSEGTRFYIGEWMPLHMSQNAWDLPAVLVVAALALWGAAPQWRRGPAGRSALLVTVGTLLMATRSLRFIGHGLILAAPFIADGVARRLETMTPGRVRLSLASLGAVGVVAVPLAAAELPPYQPLAAGMSTRNVPAQPGRWLARHHPHARTAGLMEDGFFLSWAVPDGQVLIDGRQAIFPLEALKKVTSALEHPQRLLPLLDEHGADAVVLRHNRPQHAAAIAALLAHPRWGLATVGDRHALFVRDLPPGRALTTLPPNLALRVFASDEREAARRELEAIGTAPGAAAYSGFQRALLRLADDLRGRDGDSGLGHLVDDGQRQRYAAALADLAPALGRHDNLAPAQLLAAALAVRLCQLEAASQALSLAAGAGESRLTVGLRIELAVARGDLELASTMLASLEGRDRDPWLREIGQALAQGGGVLRCGSGD